MLGAHTSQSFMECRALERRSPNDSIEQSQNTSIGWWTAQERRKKLSEPLQDFMKAFASHPLNGVQPLPAAAEQSTHRFTLNDILYLYNCTAQWADKSQWRMCREDFDKLCFCGNILVQYRQLNLQVTLFHIWSLFDAVRQSASSAWWQPPSSSLL